MNFDGFTPHEFTRFGGFVDEDDPTVLPMGVAAVAKNCRFHLTTFACRYGLQTAMQSPNKGAQISGLASLIYTPENVGESFFQVPMAFDTDGYLLIEKPVGTGRFVRVQGPLVYPPANAHAIITEAYNRGFIAYSNLLTASGPMNVYGLSTGALDPYGQKPLGGSWLASTAYLVGEYVQPTAAGGNGHLYRCTVAGTTSANQPSWPLTEGGTVTDGGVTWTESTPVLVNRLPAPNTPSIVRDSGGGTFAAGRDVYLAITFVNAQGESVPSGPAVLVDTVLNDAAQTTMPTLASLAGWIRGLGGSFIPTGCKLYEADVATGGPAPASASFALVGSYGLGAVVTVTATASGAAPPTANTARVTPGGLQPPSAPTVERASGAGSFPAGRDVYVIATFTNSSGETLPSVAGVLVDTVLDDAAQVPIPSTLYQITGVNLYECDVATGAPAPATSAYALVGTFQPLSTGTITASATGPAPPVANTSGAAGNIAPDSADVNDTGVQGLRYASIGFTNRNGNLSGTVPAFTSIFVDVPGYELYMANIPVGPSNTLNRTIGFCVADGTNVGPFFYIPSAAVSAGVLQTATVIPDNTTTTAFFNFTDEFLQAETSTDMTDRLRCIWAPWAVDVYFSKTLNRIILTGVPGYASGHYISLAADSESYYGDTSPIQVANGDGQACICARDFQGTTYSLKERGGFNIVPGPSDPSTWQVLQRWTGIGPCGPRAVCVTNDFLFFVHRSGGYAYTSGDSPFLMTKESPDQPETVWSRINWDAQQTIWCEADEEKKELRIGVPLGNATVPNQVLTLNYSGGLGGPIHFTSQDGNERYLAGARQWSLDDIAANVCVKMERKLPANASIFGTMRQSQVLFGSSSPDGTVQMITMGVYNDNGQGIDMQYETAAISQGAAVNMLGGASVSAVGSGALSVSVLVARSGVTSPGVGNQGPMAVREIPLPDFVLTPEQWNAYDAGARGPVDEWFRLRFTNRKKADAWASVKYAALWSRPLFSGRSGSGR